MDTSSRLRNLARRWNINLDESSEFYRFRNRALDEITNSLYRHLITNLDIEWDYRHILGISTSPREVERIVNADDRGCYENTAIYGNLSSSDSIQEFAFYLQPLFWVLSEHDYEEMDELVSAIRRAINSSPLVSLRIARRGKEVTLYPGGARALDEGVVDDTLAWLSNHKPVAIHYENALKLHLRKDPSQYRNLLDELRSALEKLVHRILGNRKNLENQRGFLLPWMEARGAHVQIRNLFERLLACYTQYHNDAVKHGEGWSEVDIEYMIYQTGVFMRLLLVLNGDDGN